MEIGWMDWLFEAFDELWSQKSYFSRILAAKETGVLYKVDGIMEKEL